MKKKRLPVVVGMSGGVDSSMALVLLKEQGWDPVGVSLKFPVWNDGTGKDGANLCGNAESFAIAAGVCRKLGVPYHIVDVSRDFKKEVVDYFLGRLRRHRTPNPCVMCNPRLKFKKLLAWARAHHIRYVATGHYARIRKDPKTRKYELLKGKDPEKDQTYPLSFLPQAQLRRIVFPLGAYTKQKIYQMAARWGFEVFLERKQSQDFCFASGNTLGAFLAEELGEKKGEVLEDAGRVIGQHRGLHFYTVGQRKGLGFSGGPFFVVGSDVSRNALFVTRDERRLLSREVYLSDCNFIGGKPLRSIRIKAKIRYRQTAAAGRLYLLPGNRARLLFDGPQRAVTPGQFAVFYRGDSCLGGGEILPVGSKKRS